MAKIKQPISDILSRLASLVVNEGEQGFLFSRVWNNHLDEERNYNFPKPAAFVEVITSPLWEVLGEGYRGSDLGFRIHLIHEFFNNDGTFEQDLAIFDLRDKVISLLHRYVPTGCGPLTAIREEQDFQHTQVYHYIIDYVAFYIDDAAAASYEESDPPTDLTITIPQTEH